MNKDRLLASGSLLESAFSSNVALKNGIKLSKHSVTVAGPLRIFTAFRAPYPNTPYRLRSKTVNPLIG